MTQEEPTKNNIIPLFPLEKDLTNPVTFTVYLVPINISITDCQLEFVTEECGRLDCDFSVYFRNILKKEIRSSYSILGRVRRFFLLG